MTTGFQNAAGQDMDQVFAARVSTRVATTGMTNIDGQDLADLLQPLSGAPKVGTQGFQLPDGTDISAVFDTVAGTPVNFSVTVDVIAMQSCQASAHFLADGTISIEFDGDDNGNSYSPYWFNPPVAGIGSQYQILFHQTAMTGTAGTLDGNTLLDTWTTINDSYRLVSVTANTKVGRGKHWAADVSIRRISDQVVVCTGTVSIDVFADFDG